MPASSREESMVAVPLCAHVTDAGAKYKAMDARLYR